MVTLAAMMDRCIATVSEPRPLRRSGLAAASASIGVAAPTAPTAGARRAARRAVMVELVGPWGAGKTSLVHAVATRHESAFPAPAMWLLAKSLLALGGIRALPNVAALCWRARRPLWAETKQLVRLRALFLNLHQQRRSGYGVVLVEDGPAVLLSWLRETVHRVSPGGRSPRWWRALVRRWSRSADIVVFLDAPNDVLTRRVLTRAQDNPYKGGHERELAEWLERSSAAYADVRADLESSPGPLPRMLAFRTDRTSIPEVADAVLAAIAEEQHVA